MAKEMTESQMDQITDNTRKQLEEQPKVSIKLHLPQEEMKKIEAARAAGKNSEIPFETVCVNGHIFQIQRGVKVEVPQTVADILEDAGMI
jgi:hypothetical protein